MRSDFEARFCQIIRALTDGDNLKAQAELEALAIQNPEMPGIRLGVATIQKQNGFDSSANQIISDLNRDFPAYWSEKAPSLIDIGQKITEGVGAAEKGEFSKAIELLDSVVKFHSEEGLFHIVAICKYRQNDLLGAMESIDNELRLFPNNTEAVKLRDSITQMMKSKGRTHKYD